MLRCLIALMALLLLASCERQKAPPAKFRDASALYAKYGCDQAVIAPRRVSIASLINNPSAYEGKAVAVDGYYYASFEHSAIYSAPHDYKQDGTEAGLWVLGEIPESDSGRRLALEGIFTTGTRGHLGQWPGTICHARVVVED